MTLFECQNTNMPEGTDGSLFLQNGDIGQGSGGYTMNNARSATVGIGLASPPTYPRISSPSGSMA